jgi:hypothetical protein
VPGLTVESTHPPIQWNPGLKRQGLEADHSPLTSDLVKKTWTRTSTPPIRLHGAVLRRAQEQLYRYLHLTEGKRPWKMITVAWYICVVQGTRKFGPGKHLWCGLSRVELGI